MEVDNFSQIGQLLDWPDEDTFFFGQIISRRKDQADKEAFGPDNKVLKDYYFESRKKFEEKKEEIKGFCRYFNARAYIHLNRRSKKDVAFEVLSILADRLVKGEYQSIRSIYATACGQRVSDTNKKWVLDLDFKDAPQTKDAMLETLHIVEPWGQKIIATIPTVHGEHLITKPFNSARFNEVWSCDIQKNNPTLLYCDLK